MDTQAQKELLEETGGDIYYADLFMEAAYSEAAKSEIDIPKSIVDEFYRLVEQCRKRREKRLSD